MKSCKECKKEFKEARKEQVYCSKSCSSVKKGKMRKGQALGPRKNWTYRETIDKDGYVKVYGALHPYSEGRHMIPQHIVVMEIHLKRRLKSFEVVHHKNGKKQDNRLINLELMTRSNHSKLHAKNLKNQNRDSKGRYV